MSEQPGVSEQDHAGAAARPSLSETVRNAIEPVDRLRAVLADAAGSDRDAWAAHASLLADVAALIDAFNTVVVNDGIGPISAAVWAHSVDVQGELFERLDAEKARTAALAGEVAAARKELLRLAALYEGPLSSEWGWRSTAAALRKVAGRLGAPGDGGGEGG